MRTRKNWMTLTLLTTFILIFSTFASATNTASAILEPAADRTFTILHTNDFHGQLMYKVGSSSNPGYARVAGYINSVRTAVGTEKVLVADAGDEMQGSLLSNMYYGESTIGAFNAASVDIATFGNHEFDWGQTVLGERITQADYPFVTANIVKNDTGNCATAGWELPDFADNPYEILTAGTGADEVKVGFIGVTTTETPTITIASATAGLCFKEPTTAITYYYDEMKAAGAEVIVVLSHLGYNDGGYGYGIPVIGDQTLAKNLITAGKPADLIIGGHSHTNLSSATTITVSGYTASTKVVQAYYNGRNVGRADFTVTPAGVVTIVWADTADNYILNTAPADAPVQAVIDGYANDPDYLDVVNTPIGYSSVDLPRSGLVDNMMGTFIDDAIYNYLNTDGTTVNDVDMFFNNAGGLRTDLCYTAGPPASWSSSGCVTGIHDPGLLTFGNMFNILPFGNATVVGDMTGAQILEMLNQGALIATSGSSPAGTIQPAGIKYSYYAYRDANPGPQPWAWGAFDVEVFDKASSAYVPLDLTKTYKVGTNEFLAPAGGDNYSAFKYMTNVTYWGDMLDAVNLYVMTNHGSTDTSYEGPNGDGTLDGRIIRDGTNTTGTIVPVTILHHNDSHGNLVKGSYVGYTQLATLIKQEKLHNPDNTLLLSSGDNIQGDAMSYYFRTAPTGFASDGAALDSEIHMAPIIKAFNSMDYDAMVLGNHEFNFGKDVFTSVLGQANFPLLQANIEDDGSYGLATAGIKPYTTEMLGDIDVAIMGIGNHRIPNYELPSNIPGLTFTNPITVAQELADTLAPTHDLVIALTHIGFTENASSVEVDENVDTNLAQVTNGIDAIIGGHSHTDPSKQTAYSGAYKYLPSILPNTDGDPVVINHAYRYNNTLGEVIMGMRSLGGGDYEVVSQTGRYITVATATVEDAATVALMAPYVSALTTYNNTPIGDTTAPIDTMAAFTQETNGANLQADASVYVLEDAGETVDFHLSGAMTNKLIAVGATPASPYALKISDMFSAMPYENSLVVISMNGPQLKAVLERAYRNYYYYKYVPLYGGYSYYTTCMLDTNAGNEIKYNDLGAVGYDPAKEYVVSLKIGSDFVDFDDADTYYNVSTVNYLAAGSCNFNNAGVTLWPLDQIVADTQMYVRDAVIDYVTHEGSVSPAIEGRLAFIYDVDAPSITIDTPTDKLYKPTDTLTLDFSAVDVGVAGVKKVWADLDGTTVTDGQVIDLMTLTTGQHTLTVYAEDLAGNQSNSSVTFRFDKTAPIIMITSPKAIAYPSTGTVLIDFSAVEIGGAGLDSVWATLDGAAVVDEQVVDLATLANGNHELIVYAKDNVGNEGNKSVIFGVKTTPPTPLFPALSSTTPNPKFIWTVVPDQTMYEIVLMNKDGKLVKTMLVDTPSCTSTTCTYKPVPGLGLVNGDYKWRVRSYNEVWSDFSVTKVFTKMDPPDPISPSGLIKVPNPKFTWERIPGATRYTIMLQFRTGELIRTMLVRAPVCNLTTCSYKSPVSLNLLAHDRYKWKVRAFNGMWGSYSPYLRFER